MRAERWLLVAGVWMVPAVAAAYVDPGTGSMFFQAAIASLLAALFTLKLYWRRLKSWFVGRKDSAELPKDADGGR